MSEPKSYTNPYRSERFHEASADHVPWIDAYEFTLEELDRVGAVELLLANDPDVYLQARSFGRPVKLRAGSMLSDTVMRRLALWHARYGTSDDRVVRWFCSLKKSQQNGLAASILNERERERSRNPVHASYTNFYEPEPEPVPPKKLTTVPNRSFGEPGLRKFIL